MTASEMRNSRVKIQWLLLVIVVCYFSLPVSGQRFFVSTTNSINKIRFDNAGCKSEAVRRCISEASSIALHGNTLYFIEGRILKKAILQNNEFIHCNYLAELPASITSLTVHTNGDLYLAGEKRLYRFNPVARSLHALGEMSYRSAGDMVFYNGNLYMASTEGIVEVNVDTPLYSTLIIPIANSTMFGLASLAVDCNKNGVFGFVTKQDKTELLELDLDNNAITRQVCSFNFGVLDAASMVEDGSFAGIVIEEINIEPVCKVPGKASMSIVCEAGFIPYTFILNNSIQNTTGYFENLDPGTYTLQIVTPSGCKKDTVVSIPNFYHQYPLITGHQSTATCNQENKVWFSSSNSSLTDSIVYNRRSYPFTHHFEGLANGYHRFDFKDKFNCVFDSATVVVNQQVVCDEILFPSAFTPNKDGKNDKFKGTINVFAKNFKLSIYNRWGQEVFSTNDQMTGWDGSYKGHVQPNGAYVWYVYYEIRGEKKLQKGTLTLLK